MASSAGLRPAGPANGPEWSSSAPVPRQLGLRGKVELGVFCEADEKDPFRRRLFAMIEWNSGETVSSDQVQPGARGRTRDEVVAIYPDQESVYRYGAQVIRSFEPLDVSNRIICQATFHCLVGKGTTEK